MKQFLPEDLVLLLTKTDELLESEFEMLVIGGAAASLAYGATRTTTDIDLARQPPDALLSALQQAMVEIGVSIPIQFVGLYEPPYAYENRLTALKKPRLTKLHVFFPDRHDLALMKTVRGYENDIQAIEEMHLTQPMDLDLLVDRFMSEMTQVIGAPSTIRLNFLALVERLFGEQSMEWAQEVTRNWPPLVTLEK